MEITMTADSRHIPALIELWMEAFGEEREQILPFFQELFPLCRAFCVVEGQTLCAMAYAIPQGLKMGNTVLSAAYVYAVATKKEYQGRGIASRLLQEMAQCLKKDGVQGLMLVPANPGLFSFYEKLGFTPFSARDFREIVPGEGTAELCGADVYLLYRERFLGDVPHNRPPAEMLRHLKLYRWDGGCGAAEKTENGLVFRELLGDPVGAGAIVLAMGEDRAAAWTEGSVPYAVAKPLTEDFPTKGYFAFAME